MRNKKDDSQKPEIASTPDTRGDFSPSWKAPFVAGSKKMIIPAECSKSMETSYCDNGWVSAFHSEKSILDRKSKTKNMEKAIPPQELGVLPLCKVMLEHTLKKLSKAT